MLAIDDDDAARQSVAHTSKRRIVSQLSESAIPPECRRVEVLYGGASIIIDARPFDRGTPPKDLCILRKTKAFFEIESNFAQIQPIMDEESGAVSLRILDFLVTNYSRSHSVTYRHNGQFIALFALYKSALKAYSKKSFDAFCRRERIMITLDTHKQPLITTHAQLNFLMWCVRFDVIAYALRHKAELDDSMSRCAKMRKLHAVHAVDRPANDASSACDDA